MPSIEVTSLTDLHALVTSIRSSAQRTVHRLKEVLASEADSLQILRLMKFSGVGRHPTEDRSLNLIEQINQTFTYLASADAARWVWQYHPEVQVRGLRLNLGAHPGFDLESLEPNMVVAEVFAATHPHSNDKVRKDVRRLVAQAPEIPHRYVFFSCPGYPALARQNDLERYGDGVQVWSLPADQVIA